MINPKVIVSSAMVGFFLSCFAGFIGGAGILIILLRAVIFAVVFGGLGVGASFVFSKYLILPEDGFSPAGENPPVTASVPQSVGNAVDIAITDEALPVDEQEPAFQITQSVKKYYGTHVDSKNDLSAVESTDGEPLRSVHSDNVRQNVETPEAVSDEADEVKLNAYEKVDFSSEKNHVDDVKTSAAPLVEEAVPEIQETEVKADTEEKGGQEQARGGLEIDELPDLTDLVDSAVGESSGLIADSDFADSDSHITKKSGLNSKELSKSMKDSETLAKAIETVLANDE